ncbi:hypothetical protein PsYK624_126600 [Phanerochaete sordida]|uniref:Uncharacterized protein n=1 Tax=Phanerochaete sordida TaxID=48140 RepID=A0A9P3LIR8_9APHY|nr:hypothetical protein PsYK624_126600 [Phanerochaete sordida]
MLFFRGLNDIIAVDETTSLIVFFFKLDHCNRLHNISNLSRIHKRLVQCLRSISLIDKNLCVQLHPIRDFKTH